MPARVLQDPEPQAVPVLVHRVVQALVNDVQAGLHGAHALAEVARQSGRQSGLISENIVHGGAAKMPCTVLLLSNSTNCGYSRQRSTSKSGRVSTRTSYPASLYGLLHEPVPPQRSRMTLCLLVSFFANAVAMRPLY